MNFKRKYFKGRCLKCNRVGKLAFVGENEKLGVVWLRCGKCLETHSFPVERVRKTGHVLTESELEKRENAKSKITNYSAKKTYWIGQKIRHSKFNDVGEIVKKEQTAGNNQMIVVKFENKGIIKLIEGYEAS